MGNGHFSIAQCRLIQHIRRLNLHQRFYLGSPLRRASKKGELLVAVGISNFASGAFAKPVHHQLLRIANWGVLRSHQPDAIVLLPDRVKEVVSLLRRHLPRAGDAVPKFGVMVGKDGPVIVAVKHNGVVGLLVRFDGGGERGKVVEQDAAAVVVVQPKQGGINGNASAHKTEESDTAVAQHRNSPRQQGRKRRQKDNQVARGQRG